MAALCGEANRSVCFKPYPTDRPGLFLIVSLYNIFCFRMLDSAVYLAETATHAIFFFGDYSSHCSFLAVLLMRGGEYEKVEVHIVCRKNGFGSGGLSSALCLTSTCVYGRVIHLFSQQSFVLAAHIPYNDIENHLYVS